MPFTFPEDMTMESYESTRSAKPYPPEVPPGMDWPSGGGGGGGHDHDEEESWRVKIENRLVSPPGRIPLWCVSRVVVV